MRRDHEAVRGLDPLDPSTYVEGEHLERLQDSAYVAEGIDLLKRHYKVTATEPTAVAVALSWHLMRAHVPYFMPPARRRGRPKSLKAVFPLVRALLMGQREGGVSKAPGEILEFFANELGDVTPETLEREFRRWLKSGGGNSPE